MAIQYFDQVLAQGLRQGQIPNRTKEARVWYRDAAKKMSKVNESALFKGEGAVLKNSIIPGNMYMFYYDPKLKKTLPYYDTFPLVFPIGPAEGGFLGLNMHYLPLPLRAKLMDALYTTTTNTKFDETTKLKVNYETLVKTKNMAYFKPCLKHYLYNHLRSKFIYVLPTEWDIALFLPTARFEKASQNEVWADSKRIIGA